MSTNLTEQEFSRHLNTTFELVVEDQKLELRLVDVKAYDAIKIEQAGMQRFSVFFEAGSYLPQQIYHLEHESMGELDLFLVPIAGNQKSFRYEAIFNYFEK